MLILNFICQLHDSDLLYTSIHYISPLDSPNDSRFGAPILDVLQIQLAKCGADRSIGGAVTRVVSSCVLHISSCVVLFLLCKIWIKEGGLNWSDLCSSAL